MSAHALHFPGRPQILRWAFAVFAIVLAHAAAVAALVLWYKRTPPEPPFIPAIVVSLEPAAPVTPIEDEKPLPAKEQPRIDPTPEPQVETKTEPPPEEVIPPPRPAEVVLPKPEPKPKPVERKVVERKPVEKKLVEKKPVEKRPVEQPRQPQEAQEKAAARQASHQSNVPASNNYNALVIGQLERAKGSRPEASAGNSDTAVAFSISNSGSLLGVRVTKSSGSSVLDQAALAIVRRAAPFPHFPPEMTQSQASFGWTVKFR